MKTEQISITILLILSLIIIGCGESREFICDDNSTKLADDGCNLCTCENNEWACQTKECTVNICEEGDIKPADDECNMCLCEGGEWNCTEIDCSNYETCECGDACPAPEYWVCASDGNTYCNECVINCSNLEVADPAICATCSEGETKNMENEECGGTCICSNGEWECTVLPCMECSEGETKQTEDGCNSCSCNNGIWACTEIDCIDS